MRNVYIPTIDNMPTVFDGNQLLFVFNGAKLTDMCYDTLSEVRKLHNIDAKYRTSKGWGSLGRYGYLRVKVEDAGSR